MFLTDGPAVGAPEVCVETRRHSPHTALRTALRNEAFALDPPSAGVIIGA
jgi:hypothetical protein